MATPLATPAHAADRSARYKRNFTVVDPAILNPTRNMDVAETITALHQDGLFFLAEGENIYIVPDGNIASDRPFQARPGADMVTVILSSGVEENIRWIEGRETFYSFVNRVLQTGCVRGQR